MIRIWFNHWFSTAYSIIQLIKKDESDFQIIGSNEREQAVYKKVCDEWHIEPVLKDEGEGSWSRSAGIRISLKG